jgi:hypothetical protein
MAAAFLSRWCPVPSKTTRCQYTLASSWHTILWVTRCSASCAVSSTSSRVMGSSVPVCSNRLPLELMRLADSPDRTFAGRRNRIYRCAVCQVEFSVGGGSIYSPLVASRLALERAIDSIQTQLAAVSERIGIMESHHFVTQPFASSPGPSRSPPGFAGNGSLNCACNIIPWDLDEMGFGLLCLML